MKKVILKPSVTHSVAEGFVIYCWPFLRCYSDMFISPDAIISGRISSIVMSFKHFLSVFVLLFVLCFYSFRVYLIITCDINFTSVPFAPDIFAFVIILVTYLFKKVKE